MNIQIARSAAAWLVLWCGLVAFSVARWIGLFYLSVWVVQVYGAWPIVRFALSVGLVGVTLFFLSEQVAELSVRDMERRR